MALDIPAKLGRLRARGITELNLGVTAYADGHWDEAADLYTRGQDDLLRAGDRSTAAHCASSLAELLISRGDWTRQSASSGSPGAWCARPRF